MNNVVRTVGNPSDKRTFKMLVTCDLCQNEFQFGPSIYEGKCSEPLKLSVCEGCYSPMDGFAPFVEKTLENHFKKHGLKPFPKNGAGDYIWPLAI